MDTLQAAYRDDDDDDGDGDGGDVTLPTVPVEAPPPKIEIVAVEAPPPKVEIVAVEAPPPEIEMVAVEAPPPEIEMVAVKPDPEEASDELSGSVKSLENENDDDDDDDLPPKKQKQLSSLAPVAAMAEATPAPVVTVTAASKKSKKKGNNVWVTKSTRKGKKKSKAGNHNGGSGVNGAAATAAEDTVLIAPVARFPDKSDDSPELRICLSKVYKAEKVELSEDRFSAGSTKGYRMVRATRGVVDGAWYFEIKVVNLGETGHTRLGWSTEKADLQAPVGYDGNSFGYRDVDGSKVHKALREKYSEEGYKEGDVIGFYINLPGGAAFAPKDPQLVVFKGQRYACSADSKDGPPKVVPGSEISFFKNGVCQGVAFKDLEGGRYYPAASMYTLPNQPNCVVKFNFGPDFEFFPKDFDGRPSPTPVVDVPYHGFDTQTDNVESNEKKPLPV